MVETDFSYSLCMSICVDTYYVLMVVWLAIYNILNYFGMSWFLIHTVQIFFEVRWSMIFIQNTIEYSCNHCYFSDSLSILVYLEITYRSCIHYSIIS